MRNALENFQDWAEWIFLRCVCFHSLVCFCDRRVAPLSSECATQFELCSLGKSRHPGMLLKNWLSSCDFQPRVYIAKQQIKYQALHAEPNGLKYFSLITSLDSWEFSGFRCVDLGTFNSRCCKLRRICVWSARIKGFLKHQQPKSMISDECWALPGENTVDGQNSKQPPGMVFQPYK